ncbi:MAG: septum formation inhibitor Maf [Nitrosospira sp.]|nr:septum formation inhibitor Maf [Nitrosospira sp.]
MTLPENRIYLASRSPRRHELLRQIDVNFLPLSLREALPRAPDVDETPLPGEAPADYVCRVAGAKAETGRRRVTERGLPDLPVLAADTAVVLGERIYGKPHSPAHAKAMLGALSGQTHHILTAVAVVAQQEMQVRVCVSTVRFRNISDREIRGYLACREGHDKAGAYAIQGKAAVFVAEISGSYSGVVGLPLFETAQLLEEAGIELFP